MAFNFPLASTSLLPLPCHSFLISAPHFCLSICISPYNLSPLPFYSRGEERISGGFVGQKKFFFSEIPKISIKNKIKEKENESEIKEKENESEIKEKENESEIKEKENESEIKEKENESEIKEKEIKSEIKEKEIKLEIKEKENESEIKDNGTKSPKEPLFPPVILPKLPLSLENEFIEEYFSNAFNVFFKIAFAEFAKSYGRETCFASPSEKVAADFVRFSEKSFSDLVKWFGDLECRELHDFAVSYIEDALTEFLDDPSLRLSTIKEISASFTEMCSQGFAEAGIGLLKDLEKEKKLRRSKRNKIPADRLGFGRVLTAAGDGRPYKPLREI